MWHVTEIWIIYCWRIHQKTETAASKKICHFMRSNRWQSVRTCDTQLGSSLYWLVNMSPSLEKLYLHPSAIHFPYSFVWQQTSSVLTCLSTAPHPPLVQILYKVVTTEENMEIINRGNYDLKISPLVRIQTRQQWHNASGGWRGNFQPLTLTLTPAHCSGHVTPRSYYHPTGDIVLSGRYPFHNIRNINKPAEASRRNYSE